MKLAFLLTVALAGAVAGRSATVADCGLVPGWQQQGPARSYTAENLFDYMDGNAEGYLIYGFRRMDGVTCQKGEDSILIDISEMADTDAAYGIFSANRDARRPVERIGMMGQIQPRRAVFCKGRYYVELAANPDKDHTSVLRAYVAAIEQRISGSTVLPETLSWFPSNKRTSVRLIPESVLGMRVLKRGYVAQYEFGKAFIETESSPEAAAAVMEKLRARFAQAQPAKVADEAFQVSDRYLGRLCFFRKGRYLGGYANVAEGQDPSALATILANQLP